MAWETHEIRRGSQTQEDRFRKKHEILRGEPRGEQEVAANPVDDGIRMYDGAPVKTAPALDPAPLPPAPTEAPADLNLDLPEEPLPDIDQVIGAGEDDVPAPAAKPSPSKAKPLPKGFKPLS